MAARCQCRGRAPREGLSESPILPEIFVDEFVIMAQFSMFVWYRVKATGEEENSGPIPLRAQFEREAEDAAIAVADFIFDDLASEVLIQVFGSDGSGRLIAEIKRPMLN